MKGSYNHIKSDSWESFFEILISLTLSPNLIEIDFLVIMLISVCEIKLQQNFLQPTKGSIYKVTELMNKTTIG